MIRKKKAQEDKTALDFLPDADEIERRPLPRQARITLHVLGLAVLAFIIWASLAETDLIVSARGRLVTPLPNIVVQPLDTSIIQSIEVRPGQVVKKGERLATLDPTFTEADETQLRSRLHSLDTQLRRLEYELSGKPIKAPEATDPDTRLQARLAEERRASFNAQSRRLDEAIARIRAAIETNRGEQQMLSSRVTVLRENAGIQERLVSQQLAIRSRLLDAQDRLFEAERGQQTSQNRAQELRKELGSAEAEKVAFETGWRQKIMEELLSISRERDSVNEQLLKADKRNELVTLSSPVDAVVLEVAKLSPGSVARATEPVFTLVPLTSELEAEVKIDAIDVGYIKIGDDARIKLDAYPYQKHGGLSGELRTLSEDAFRRDSDPSATMEAFYTARIRLKTTRLRTMPEHARLLPGMTLSAEIAVGKRSVGSYLIWPLIRALDESIREP
ncbi:HlyD family type I secretion periplasmic adaptor subunit [Propionivibrio dicarboxylicus]|uniref:Membrane fusion protein (MFP) family protein n=1 Tax=Propionivibrio dicarboxylicus TaxID=83767 RepID=A0A1G8H983_9RHOO|nr:HlyD family type I secretion periplasmic adaptor subunit [Propionivibrio dicarboxylicus]SDI03173.1 HlyD family secretion protein [Propionivibrio dicarboxylicus]